MKITKKEFLSILKNKNACPEAVIDLWNECDRADWLLSILSEMVGQKGWPSRKTVVLCACDCAETSLEFIPENENRPKIAIQTARKWAEGKASKMECKKAADDAYVSYIYAAAAADAASASFAASAAANASDAVAASASFAASFAASSVAFYDASYDDYVAKEFLSILKNKNACPEAVIDLWNECDRADWLLLILSEMVGQKGWPSRKTVVLCACDCAETSLRFISEDENRPKIAIQTARDWAEGKATKIECEKAADDAAAAFASSSAVYVDAAVSSHAAAAASYVASAYAAHDDASSYAHAADAAASYVASAYAHAADVYDDAKKEVLKNMADIIRKRVPF
jgi:hypothetical protein